MISTLDHALHYANLGVPVLPLHTIVDGKCSCGNSSNCKPGKHPYGSLVKNGLKDATVDAKKIITWFKGKSLNIGIVTGRTSGFFVLDRDDRDDGHITLKSWEDENGALPETLIQKTGNGAHYFFKIPEDIEIRNFQGKKNSPGIDVRGEGGYVCATPSKHQNGNHYQWVDCDFMDTEKIADAPEWLINKILNNPGNTKSNKTIDFDSISKIPEKIKDGEGRESYLLSLAGKLRSSGLSQDLIERILLDFNQLHIDPPLDQSTVLEKAKRYQTDGANNITWGNPRELKSSLPDVPYFDFNLLPDVTRNWVRDIAERMQCPPDFLAVGAIVVAGSIIGNKICVQPKELDNTWLEAANLWGAVIGRPGVMKTPALSEVMRPLKLLEIIASQQHANNLLKFRLEKFEYESLLKRLKTSLNKGTSLKIDDLPGEPEEPKPKRYLINDATYQKIGEVLSANSTGMMIFQDELSGLLMRLDTEGQEAARAFYLQAWEGKQPYTFDRIERGTTSIDRLCFSVLGGIQPSKMRDYIRSAVHGGKGDDGLVQRIQLLVYPDVTKVWTLVDRLPDQVASEAAINRYLELAEIDPVAIGAHLTPSGIYALGFDSNAQQLFNTWWEKLESNLRQKNLHPALESHYSKYRKLIPALALIDHLMHDRVGAIQRDSLIRAIGWHKYLWAHAKRVYASINLTSVDSAIALYKKISSGSIKDGFTLRDVYRNGWSLLSSPKDVAEAVEVLLDHGWLQSYTDKIPGMDGRPTIRFIINPLLRKAA